MKRTKPFLSVTVILIISYLIACNSNPETHKGEIDIIDARTTKEPAGNLLLHKAYDVEIYRIIFMGEGYKVRYYQTENSVLTNHEAMFMVPEDYDRAQYKWISDTSVYIRLFNTNTNQEKKFEVFGYGSVTGIRD